MLKTKLYKVVAKLGTHELNRLQGFVIDGSQKRSKPNQLLLTLCTWHKSKPVEVPTKEMLWNTLYLSESYDDQRLRKLCTDALQQLERFISMEAYFEDVFSESTHRLIAFQKRGLDALYRSQAARVRSAGGKETIHDAKFYYHQYLIEQSQYEMSQASVERFKVADIDLILNNLDKFYIIEKLRYH